MSLDAISALIGALLGATIAAAVQLIISARDRRHQFRIAMLDKRMEAQ